MFRNIVWSGLENLIRLVCGFFITSLVIRTLGPENWGLLASRLSLYQLLIPLVTMGTEQIAVRELVRQGMSREVMRETLKLRLMGSLIASAIFLLCIRFLDWSAPLMLWLLFPLAYIPFVFQGWGMALQAAHLTRRFSQAMIVQSVAGAALRTYGILWDMPLEWYAFCFVLELIPSSILMWKMAQKCGFEKEVTSERRVFWKYLFWEGWPLAVGGLAVGLYSKMDQLMIFSMLGAEETAYYNAAVRVHELATLPSTMICMVIFPHLARLGAKKQNRFFTALEALFCCFFWGAFGVSLGIFLLSRPLCFLLYGDDFNSTPALLQGLIWTQILVWLGVAGSQYIAVQGLQIHSLYRTLVGAGINLGANLYLIPRMGAEGAVWATIGSQMVAVVVYPLLIPSLRPLVGFLGKSLNILTLISSLGVLRNLGKQDFSDA